MFEKVIGTGLIKPLGFEVVVSRTFKNLRSRGNPVLVVPQVLML